MFHDEIFDCISDDGVKKQDIKIDTHTNIFLKIECDGKMIGLYILHDENGTTMKVHANILPEYRKEHSSQSAKELIKWFLVNTDKQKLVASIPSLYQNVIAFCLKHGFLFEGMNRLSHTKNGVIYDQVNLGATRKELEEFIHGIF